MTDERFEQILKESLDLEIQNEEIFSYKKVNAGNRVNMLKKAGVIAAVAVAVLALGIGILGAASPALAAKLPLIGGIFARTQDNYTFSGDYTDKATALLEEDDDVPDSFEYISEDGEYTLTASEVYCDGYSIYLTLNVQSQDSDLTEVQYHYSQTGHETTIATLYTPLTWRIYDGEGNVLHEVNEPNGRLEGMPDDAYNFSGMIKLDLPARFEDGFTAELAFNAIAYDNRVHPATQEHSEKTAYWTNGSWVLKFPVSIDSDVRTFPVNEPGGDFILKEVMVSDYQVVVNTESAGSSPFTINTIIFDQDGNHLQSDSEKNGIARFPVQGKDLTLLDIYVFDWSDGSDAWFEVYKGGNLDALDRAIIHKEIVLE